LKREGLHFIISEYIHGCTLTAGIGASWIAYALAPGGYFRDFKRSYEVAADLCLRVVRAEDAAYNRPTTAGIRTFAGTFSKLAEIDSEIPVGGSQIGPLHGYLFKIITRQGRNAIGGEKSYVDDQGK
jgi:hypothetical protein